MPPRTVTPRGSAGLRTPKYQADDSKITQRFIKIGRTEAGRMSDALRWSCPFIFHLREFHDEVVFCGQALIITSDLGEPTLLDQVPTGSAAPKTAIGVRAAR